MAAKAGIVGECSRIWLARALLLLDPRYLESFQIDHASEGRLTERI